jgi:hypothetical protein
MRFVTIAALAALVLTGAAGGSWADSTSPGKTSAFESASINALTVGTADLLTATLLKGKAKNVLAIEATMTTNTGGDGTLHMVPTVNGVAVQGTTVNQPCAFTVAHCTVTGTWWLDLDAAEAANPGSILKVPLEITLEGGVLAGGEADVSATVTLSVRMVKK